MPIYKDKKSKDGWLVRIYRQGKPRSKTVHGTKKEAIAFHDRWRHELELAGPTSTVHRTAPGFASFCLTSYRKYAQAHLGEKTWKVRRYVLAMLCDYFREKKLDKFTAADLEAFQLWRRKQVGPVTVNGDMMVLRAVLRYAVDRGVPAQRPKVKALKEIKRKGRVQVWTADEVQRLYAAIQELHPWLLGIVVVLINTGMRKGEALAMEWSWVDLDRGMISIQPNRHWRPKNNEPREVPIGEAARHWLAAAKEAKRAHERWVFPTQRRRGASDGRYALWPDQQFNNARDKAEIGGSPHVCRHTYASHFLAAVPDMFLLSQVLGHSHVRITKIYSHLLPGHLERARDAVNIAPPTPKLLPPKSED